MKTQKFELGFRGYIFSRRIEENLIPQRVQNLVIRDFSERKNILFKLSATEYKMKNSYIVLKNTLKELKELDGIIFYSVHMLPKDSLFRYQIYKKILLKKKKIYFALEDLKFQKKNDVKIIETILKVKKITSND
tara:strand:+ start:315 stop:716 length:402 start_codon:yes stop_codon:yes gene_type:complete